MLPLSGFYTRSQAGTKGCRGQRWVDDTWQDGLNGGLLGISDLLLRQNLMSTYLNHDWGRDWGSLRKFDTIVKAEPAQSQLGTATHSGLFSPGKIRIKP